MKQYNCIELQDAVSAMTKKLGVAPTTPGFDFLLLIEMFVSNEDCRREINRAIWKHIEDD